MGTGAVEKRVCGCVSVGGGGGHQREDGWSEGFSFFFGGGGAAVTTNGVLHALRIPCCLVLVLVDAGLEPMASKGTAQRWKIRKSARCAPNLLKTG